MQTLQKLSETKGELFEQIDPKKGDNNANFISADMSHEYLMNVIEEKNTAGENWAITDGIILKDGITDKEKYAKEIADLYLQLQKEYPNLTRIYSVVNMSSNPNINHQNWIFYNPTKEIFVRFEPNGPDFAKRYEDMGKLKLKEFMQKIWYYMGKNPEQFKQVFAYGKAINYFSGCRATSTLLTLMDMYNLDPNVLFKKYHQDEKSYFLPLVHAMSQEIQNEACYYITKSTKRGRSKQSFTAVVPTSVYQNINEKKIRKMTVKELQDFLARRRVKFTSKMRKPELLNLALQQIN